MYMKYLNTTALLLLTIDSVLFSVTALHTVALKCNWTKIVPFAPLFLRENEF